MADPFTLTALITAGATAAGTEAVKETTKDAYHKLRDKVGEVFGPRASKAIVKVEEPTTVDEGRKELERYVGDTLDADEATALEPLVAALVGALKDDPVATAAAHARVGLDIEAGGDALVRDIEGAREVVAKIRAGKDVTVEGLRMDTGRSPGK